MVAPFWDQPRRRILDLGTIALKSVTVTLKISKKLARQRKAIAILAIPERGKHYGNPN